MPFTLEKSVASFQTVWMDTSSPPRYRTKTYQLPSTHNPITSLSKNARLSVSYTNYQSPPQTTSAASLKLNTNPSSNPDSFDQKSTIFVVLHLYMSSRHSPTGWTLLSSVLVKCRSVTSCIFVCETVLIINSTEIKQKILVTMSLLK